MSAFIFIELYYRGPAYIWKKFNRIKPWQAIKLMKPKIYKYLTENI